MLAIFNELSAETKPRFAVGICDDVTNLSLPLVENSPCRRRRSWNAPVYGLGSDGSVSATKNNIKIIGNSTPWFSARLFRL